LPEIPLCDHVDPSSPSQRLLFLHLFFSPHRSPSFSDRLIPCGFLLGTRGFPFFSSLLVITLVPTPFAASVLVCRCSCHSLAELRPITFLRPLLPSPRFLPSEPAIMNAPGLARGFSGIDLASWLVLLLDLPSALSPPPPHRVLRPFVRRFLLDCPLRSPGLIPRAMFVCVWPCVYVNLVVAFYLPRVKVCFPRCSHFLDSERARFLSLSRPFLVFTLGRRSLLVAPPFPPESPPRPLVFLHDQNFLIARMGVPPPSQVCPSLSVVPFWLASLFD